MIPDSITLLLVAMIMFGAFTYVDHKLGLAIHANVYSHVASPKAKSKYIGESVADEGDSEKRNQADGMDEKEE